MKKLTALLLVVVLCFGLLAGCGSEGGSEGGDAAGEPITIKSFGENIIIGK